MSAPNVVVVPPASPLLPGSVVNFTWTVTDADNRTLTWACEGTDSQGNVVNLTGQLTVQDTFQMTSFTLGGVALTIDNTNRKATGIVPAA